MTTTPKPKYTRSKILSWAWIGYLILFGLLILAKNLMKQGPGGWSEPPILDYILVFGLGICLFMMGSVNAYFAWTNNAQDYVEWFAEQSSAKKHWQTELMQRQSTYSLWSARLVAPLLALTGIGLIGFTVFQIAAAIASRF